MLSSPIVSQNELYDVTEDGRSLSMEADTYLSLATIIFSLPHLQFEISQASISASSNKSSFYCWSSKRCTRFIRSGLQLHLPTKSLRSDDYLYRFEHTSTTSNIQRPIPIAPVIPSTVHQTHNMTDGSGEECLQSSGDYKSNQLPKTHEKHT